MLLSKIIETEKTIALLANNVVVFEVSPCLSKDKLLNILNNLYNKPIRCIRTTVIRQKPTKRQKSCRKVKKVYVTFKEPVSLQDFKMILKEDV
jgi:ribosomal protein L23